MVVDNSSTFDIFDSLQSNVKTISPLSCWGDINVAALLNEAVVENLFNKISSSTHLEICNINKDGDQHNSWNNQCTIPHHEETCPKKSVFSRHLNHLIVKHQLYFQDQNKLFPTAILINKRVAITKVITKTILSNYHNVQASKKDSPKKSNKERNKCENVNKGENNKETDILMQLSVKTLTTFFFSLMRMSWSSSDPNMRLICSEVLQSCTDLLATVPALSLANISKLPKLAKSCLDDVKVFLAKLLFSSSDTITLQLKASVLEILLGLATLRGDIGDLLEWIQISIKLCLEDKAQNLKLDHINHWLGILKGCNDCVSIEFVLGLYLIVIFVFI